MKKTNFRSTIILLLTAIIWGTAFAAQSAGTDFAEPFTFNSLRSIMGGLVLLPYIYFTNRKKQNRETGHRDVKTLMRAGIFCGILLAAASAFQQIGIQYTTVGKGGFITALYIVLVPVLGLLAKKRVEIQVWVGVLLSIVGLYFLCMTERFSVSLGDFYIFLCAVCFSLHILVIDYFSPKVDGVKMACIQFFVCGFLSGIPMLLLEHPRLELLLAGWLPILYAGVMSSGVAYTLQIIGQRDTDPTIASLILSLEAVVSVLAGFLLLGERLSKREVFGCVLMFAAIILAQLPGGGKTIE